jgi:hypothetical protein
MIGLMELHNKGLQKDQIKFSILRHRVGKEACKDCY